MMPAASCATLCPYTTLFRSRVATYDRSRALVLRPPECSTVVEVGEHALRIDHRALGGRVVTADALAGGNLPPVRDTRSEEHTSELQSQSNLVCRLLLGKKKQ